MEAAGTTGGGTVVDVVVVVAGTATVVVAGDPDSAVCTLPAVSATENPEAFVTVTVADEPAGTDVATTTEQTPGLFWETEEIVPPVTFRSVPSVDERVEQLMGSFPVTVNAGLLDAPGAAGAASASAGGV